MEDSALNTILFGISSHFRLPPCTSASGGQTQGELGPPPLDGSAAAVKSQLVTLHFFFPHDLLPALDLLDRKLLTRLHVKNDSAGRTTTTAAAAAAATEGVGEVEVWYVQSASAVLGDHTTSTSTSATATATATATASSSSSSRAVAQGLQGRYRNARGTSNRASQTQYEVRLDSWNCSCAAFAFKALQLLNSGQAAESEEGLKKGVEAEAGVTRRQMESNEPLVDSGGARQSNKCSFGGTVLPNQVSMSGGVPICKHILAVILASAAPQLFGSSVRSKEVTVEELAGRAVGWDDYG